MKKRFFKLVGLGLGICAATILIPLGIVVVFRFATTGRISLSLTELLLSGFAKAFYPFIFSSVIGACLLGVSMPYDKKENRTQAPKKYKIAIVLEIIGILFVSIGLAWLLRSIDNKHRSLALWVATIGAGLIAVITTGALLAVASAKKQKKNWGGILISWIPVLCILLIASPWTDAPPSVNISLPSISLFSKEKTEAKIVADPIQVSIDPFRSNAYLTKCTIRNTGNADAENIVVGLYYYDVSGVKQTGGVEVIDYLSAGKSYSLTMRVWDHTGYYPYGIHDPYLDIHYLSVS